MKKFKLLLCMAIAAICIVFTGAAPAEAVTQYVMYVGQEAPAAELLSLPGEKITSVKVKQKKILSYKKGKLKAHKEGSASVTFKAGGKKRSVSVKVVKPQVTVTMLDVGQGDSFLIKTSAGSIILIDTGEYKMYKDLKKQLAALGVGKIDALVVTHFDSDHCGSAQSVLKDFGKDAVFVHPSRESTSSTYKNLMGYVRGANVQQVTLSKADEGKAIQCLSFDGISFTLLAADEEEDMNDSSIVMRLDAYGSSWMFTGDASAKVLDDVLEKYGKETVDVDVLKVSHHGSAYSNPVLFIHDASPEIALIGVGKDNSYGHPAKTTMDRLIKYAGSIYRTDLDGMVSVTWNGKAYTADKAPASVQGQDNTDRLIIGNVKSLVCHDENCSSLPAEQNRVYFNTLEEAEAAGYRPCGKCLK